MTNAGINERTQEYENVLTRNGWRSTQVVSAQGLMASSRATLGYVESVKDATVGFAKCIWQATGSAGHETQLLAGSDRLARLAERLRQLSGHNALPIVRMLDIALEVNPACLLIIMEPVISMESAISKGANDELAVSLLRKFDPYAYGSIRWLHFDICPANSGVNAAGAPVLIDPESAYVLSSGKELDNTCLAAKWVRFPSEWMDAVAQLTADGRSFDDIAVHKHAYESLLLAAELSLGRHVEIGNANRVEEWLLPWLATFEMHDSLRVRVSFWRRHLVAAFDRSTRLNLSELASELESLSPPPLANVVVSAETSGMRRAPVKDLRDYAHRMRLDRLSESELREYLEALLTKARSEDSVEHWTEACLLCLCYLRDRNEARTLLEEATARHPTSEELERWLRMLRLWVKERA